MLRAGKRKKPNKSCSTLLLQRQFRKAIDNVMRKKSDFSIFVADHLEKLLYAQDKAEKATKFNEWIAKMNDLDFQKRTRLFFSKLHRKFKPVEQVGPSIDKLGNLSRNLSETLKNWTDFYSELYSDRKLNLVDQTPDDDPELDQDLTHKEFLDSIYALKHHKAAGADQITSEDITTLIPHVLEEDQIDPTNQISSLHFIFKILSDFWFNECVPQDFKRTILRPFLKDADKSLHNPSNYRPISLLNTLMKIYESIICKRLEKYLEKNKILSPFQAAYRRRCSTADHILTLHEIFLEYRYNKLGPRGGLSKKRLILCFLDLKKAFDSIPGN